MKEQFLPREGQIHNKMEKHRPSLWKKVKSFSQAAALVGLGIIAEGKAVSAQETGPQKAPDYQEWIKQSQIHELNIESAIKTKGQSGKLGRWDAKRWISPIDGSQTTVRYDAKGKEDLIMNQTADGSRLALDKNNDGLVDCLVVNKQPSSLRGASQNHDKIAFNELSALMPPDELAAAAETEASLDPQDKEIYFFEQDENGNQMVKRIDYKTGIIEEVDGETAKKYTESQQFNWARTLEGTEQQIQK